MSDDNKWVNAERRLPDSEQLFSKLFHSNPGMIAVSGTDNEIQYEVNDTFLETLGYTRDQVLGKTTTELDIWVKPDLRQQILATLRRDGTISNLEAQLRTKDGEIRSFVIAAELIEFGGEERMLCTSLDITTQKRSDALQRSRSAVLEKLASGAELTEVLTALVKTAEVVSPEMIGSVLLLDEEGKRLRLAAAPRLPDFYNEAIDGLEIGDGVGSCGAAAATGKPVIVEDVQEHPYWAEYRELAAQVGIRACWSQPIIGSDNQVLGTFAMYYRKPRKPTEWESEVIRVNASLASIAIERKRMEETLHASENRFRQLFNKAADSIFYFDANGRFLDINQLACDRLGYTPNELLEMSVSDIDMNFGIDSLKTLFDDIQDGTPLTFTSAHQCKDGSTFPVEIKAGVLKTGDAKSYLALARDISKRKWVESLLQKSLRKMETEVTQRKLAEQNCLIRSDEIEQLSQQKDKFFSIIAHDLKSPFNALLGYTSMLSEKAENLSHQQMVEYSTDVHRSAQRVFSLLENLLEWSQLRMGRFEMHPTALDLTRVCERTLELFAPTAQTKSVSLCNNFAERIVSTLR